MRCSLSAGYSKRRRERAKADFGRRERERAKFIFSCRLVSFYGTRTSERTTGDQISGRRKIGQMGPTLPKNPLSKYKTYFD